jgi:hypothetical protein
VTAAYFYRGHTHYLLGHDQQAIDDYHFAIEKYKADQSGSIVDKRRHLVRAYLYRSMAYQAKNK